MNESERTAREAVKRNRIAEVYTLLIKAGKRAQTADRKLQELLQTKGLDLTNLPPKDTLIKVFTTLTNPELAELKNILNTQASPEPNPSPKVTPAAVELARIFLEFEIEEHQAAKKAIPVVDEPGETGNHERTD